ncbi:hypothetical protein V7138_08080 [Bacillus sp. JJ1533]|uniref:hypothetical protein n=1 Tax=Bacillus sp. JJ1533 TaxID=3122959 RepID=UPI0030007CDC
MKLMKRKFWRNYISMDYSEVESNLKRYFKKQKVEGNWIKPQTSFMLGSKSDSNVFVSSNKYGFSIEIHKATADPVTRFFLGFTNGERHFTGVSFIKIYITKQNGEPIIRNLLSELSNKSEEKPWDVAKHPMFRNAWIMRLLIKKRWKQLV